MTISRTLLLRLCIAMSTVAASLVGSADCGAQETFQFDWKVIGTVTRWTQGSDEDTTTHENLSDTSTLILVRDRSPDVRFAFDFTGPVGRGSGLVPRAADQTLDPNFAFPSPLPPGLPPAQVRSMHGSLTRLGDGPIPPAFAIVYSETFICRTTPEACGQVKRWEVRFIGNARSTPSPPRGP